MRVDGNKPIESSDVLAASWCPSCVPARAITISSASVMSVVLTVELKRRLFLVDVTKVAYDFPLCLEAWVCIPLGSFPKLALSVCALAVLLSQ